MQEEQDAVDMEQRAKRVKKKGKGFLITQEQEQDYIDEIAASRTIKGKEPLRKAIQEPEQEGIQEQEQDESAKRMQEQADRALAMRLRQEQDNSDMVIDQDAVRKRQKRTFGETTDQAEASSSRYPEASSSKNPRNRK